MVNKVNLWLELDTALRIVGSFIANLTDDIGLTPIEFYIMRSLLETDGVHPSDLAHKMGRAATSFTPNIDKLEKKGLIERRPDPKDRRAILLYLTAQGEGYRNSVNNLADAINRALTEKLFITLEDEVFDELFDTLDGIRESLK